MSDTFSPTERTRIVREPNRAVYDRDVIYKILDEALICHLGFAVDGQPFVIPTMFARIDDAIYFHGSAASRTLRGLSWWTARLHHRHALRRLDSGPLGLQSLHELPFRRRAGQGGTASRSREETARSPRFHRKIHSRPLERCAPAQRERIESHQHPETAADRSFRKSSRTGGVEDDAPDYELSVWAGVIPLRLVADNAIRDDRCDPAIPTPDYVLNFRR